MFGGHDVATVPLAKKAELLARGGVAPAGLVDVVGAELATVEAELRPVPDGSPPGGGGRRRGRRPGGVPPAARLDRVAGSLP